MEVNVQTLSEVSREVEITATPEELIPHFNKAYQHYREKVEIRGFRKGKAPLDIIKKLYGDLIENDSLSDVANEMYRQAVKVKELKPIGEPVLVDLDYKRGEIFRCKIQYDVRPEINLKEYKNIEVDKIIHTVTDDEIEKELTRLQQANATFEEVESVTDPQHVVTTTLQDIDDNGVPIIGKRSDNIRFYLADEQLEKPFKDALKEAKKDGEYRVQFEHKHDETTHQVNTLVIVKNVQKVILPALTDEFVGKITKEKFKNVEELRTNLRTDIVAYWKEKSERQATNSIIAEIIHRHEFQIPESLIRSVIAGLLEEIKNENPKRQLPADFNIEKFSEENRAYAIYQSKWVLLREELIKAENITVSDEDLEKLADEESVKIKIPKDRLINYYKSSDQIKDRIIGDKLLKILVDSAKIKEVPEKK